MNALGTDLQPELQLAQESDIEILLPLVRSYHEFDHIDRTDQQRRQALLPLLRDQGLGAVWLIHAGGQRVGYIALCFGYSIEFQGRDAYLDEFFIEPGFRGQGLGSKTLESVLRAAAGLQVRAVYLEVAEDNLAARMLYEGQGFELRSGFHLMARQLGGPGSHNQAQ